MEAPPGGRMETGGPRNAHRQHLRVQRERKPERAKMERDGAKDAALWVRAVFPEAG